MVRGLTPDAWAISSTVASKPRLATTSMAARLMRVRVRCWCASASEGGGCRSGSSIAASFWWTSTRNGNKVPKELTKQESAVPWSPHGPTELNRRDVFVSVCLLVGGVHAPRGNHDGSLGKVLGVGVPVTVPHTR